MLRYIETRRNKTKQKKEKDIILSMLFFRYRVNTLV